MTIFQVVNSLFRLLSPDALCEGAFSKTADLLIYTQVADENYYAWGDLSWESRLLMAPKHLE
jgi:hypothetical protein